MRGAGSAIRGGSCSGAVASSSARFGYYRRLSAKNRAIYRRSDAVTKLPLAQPEDFQPCIEAMAAALEADDRKAVQRASHRLSVLLCRALQIPVTPVRVLARRPADATGELHVRHEDGRTLIRVWMRTAAHERVVAFRTFLRTLLHELCHHIDYEFLELGDSYHTRGFFQRESSLVRQLAPRKEEPAVEEEPVGGEQLGLPGFG